MLSRQNNKNGNIIRYNRKNIYNKTINMYGSGPVLIIKHC
jgi:hypothetical protein